MSDGLKAQHRTAIIATLAANDRVEKAVLFGSRAMGTNTVTSDVDIALFGQQLTLTDQASLAAACEELPMAQSVDLVLHSTIDNPALVEHIRSHGVEWYRRGGGSGVNRCAEQFSKVRALSAPIQTKLEVLALGRIGPSTHWDPSLTQSGQFVTALFNRENQRTVVCVLSVLIISRMGKLTLVTP